MQKENPYRLHKEIALSANLAFADLRKQPCDMNLLSAQLRNEYIKLSAIPWKRDGNLIIIATSRITDSLQKWAEELYGKNYIFAITTPFDINYSVNTLFARENDIEAREKLWQLQPEYSAKQSVNKNDAYIFLSIILIIAYIAYIFPVQVLAAAFVITGIFYATTLILKTILLIIGYFSAKTSIRNSLCIDIADNKLPIYTLLIPLYNEWKTLPKLVAAIQALDYPQDKLDVKLIVEEDDEVTINAIKSLQAPYIFEMIKVPYSLPRTKPKACNYALRFAHGEYVTIYDAEDEPEPEQLKKVLYKFAHADKNLACVQARLNYFNLHENTLTRMFAIEYSTLFDFMLFGMETLGIPILLGGTSNHFRTKTLQELYAWDPYNVTEDADLGIRIAQKGWHCSMVWSLTKEEAPISLWAWIKQRTRWIKGHMQTYIVHMRRPLLLYKNLGFIGFMGTQLCLGAPALIFLLSPIMWLIWLLFMLGIIKLDTMMPEWFYVTLDFSLIALFAGIFLQAIFAVAVILRNKWQVMLPYSLLFPFYWILHSIASFRAVWQLIKCPHYWEKTAHGVTKVR